MPRDLFGDVQHPTVRVGSRSRYAVPLSLAAHAAAVLVIVGATILGPVVLPGLASSALEYHVVTLPPPPPPPAAPPPPSSDPPVAPPNPNAAPTEAPEGIAPDVRFDPGAVTDLGPGVVPGVADIDTVIGTPPPPPPPVVQAPIQVGGQVRPPTKVRDVAPVYSPIALAARVQGTVFLEAVIDTEGRVQSVRVLRSPPMLDVAAIDAVRQWEYTPTLLNGTPVPVIMTVTVTFRLH